MRKIIFMNLVPKRSTPKWAMPKRATTKRAASKWSRHKVVYPKQLGYFNSEKCIAIMGDNQFVLDTILRLNDLYKSNELPLAQFGSIATFQSCYCIYS